MTRWPYLHGPLLSVVRTSRCTLHDHCVRIQGYPGSLVLTAPILAMRRPMTGVGAEKTKQPEREGRKRKPGAARGGCAQRAQDVAHPPVLLHRAAVAQDDVLRDALVRRQLVAVADHDLRRSGRAESARVPVSRQRRRRLGYIDMHAPMYTRLRRQFGAVG